MAKVGDKDITVMEFMQFLAANPSYLEMAMKQPGKTKILRAMISDQLLQRAMAREGLLSTDKPISGEDYVAAYEKLAKEHFPVGAMPSEEDLYAYYESHPQEFGIPASVHLRQIQLRVPEDATPEQQAAVRKQAEELLQRLEQGEAFTALAAEYTENPRAKVTKGDVGFLPRGTDPWLDEALQGIQPGQHTDVLKSKVGYEILQVVEQKDAVLIPFANVRTKVVEKVFNQRLNRARDRYLAELANEFGVEVLSPGLEAANPALYGAEAEGVSNEPAK